MTQIVKEKRRRKNDRKKKSRRSYMGRKYYQELVQTPEGENKNSLKDFGWSASNETLFFFFFFSQSQVWYFLIVSSE